MGGQVLAHVGSGCALRRLSSQRANGANWTAYTGAPQSLLEPNEISATACPFAITAPPESPTQADTAWSPNDSSRSHATVVVTDATRRMPELVATLGSSSPKPTTCAGPATVSRAYGIGV